MDKIAISLFRVSSDSKNLDMIFDCSRTHYFDSLKMKVEYYENGRLQTKDVDVSDALFINNISDEDGLTTHSTVKKKKWNVRLPLDKIGINYPAIYRAELVAKPVYSLYAFGSPYAWPAPYSNCKDPNDDNIYELRQALDGNMYVAYKNGPFILEEGSMVPAMLITDVHEKVDVDKMICSDVNFVYRCILENILDAPCKCEKISDEAILRYLLLYGHQAALFTGDDEIAREYFKLLNKCISCEEGLPKSGILGSTCNCRH